MNEGTGSLSRHRDVLWWGHWITVREPMLFQLRHPQIVWTWARNVLLSVLVSVSLIFSIKSNNLICSALYEVVFNRWYLRSQNYVTLLCYTRLNEFTHGQNTEKTEGLTWIRRQETVLSWMAHSPTPVSVQLPSIWKDLHIDTKQRWKWKLPGKGKEKYSPRAHILKGI